MRGTLRQITAIVFRPDEEWARIARDTHPPLAVLSLALLPPLAFACQRIATGGISVTAALVTAGAGVLMEIAGVALVAAVICMVAPVYGAPRNFIAAFWIAAYAAVPVWISGVALAAPLQDFPMLTIILLVGLMHGLYVFYLGLHHVGKVARDDAAECAGAVVLTSLVLSSVVGYYGSAAGLFPQLG